MTLVVIIGCLIESTEQCTDDFVKQMAVSVCGLSKRSISTDNNWSLLEPLRRIFGLNFGGISDVEREYRQLIGDVDEAEFLLNVSDKKKPKGICYLFANAVVLENKSNGLWMHMEVSVSFRSNFLTST